jgi:hypothetical protein
LTYGSGNKLKKELSRSKSGAWTNFTYYAINRYQSVAFLVQVRRIST